MPFCDDDRWHATQLEANNCTHHPADKGFRTLNKSHPSCSASKKRTPPPQSSPDDDEDENIDLPAGFLATPAPQKKTRGLSLSPSPLARKQGYPTPPFSQNMEDRGDNIIVAMASSDSQLPSSSPAATAAAVLRRSPKPTLSCGGVQVPSSDDGAAPDEGGNIDNIPVPLSSSPPVRLSPAAQSAANTRVLETVVGIDTTLINDGSDVTFDDDDEDEEEEEEKEGDPITPAQLAALENDILALRADRARLTETLKDSTFHIQRLQTRSRIHQIEDRLAHLDIVKARAEARAAEGLIDVAREGTRNASTSTVIVILMVLFYVLWCHWNSVEFAYIRSRMCWAYGLRRGC